MRIDTSSGSVADHALRDAVRLSRCTRRATSYEIAAAAGCDADAVRQRLMEPRSRGVCDAAAAAAVRENPTGRWRAAMWQACPPSCAKVLAQNVGGAARFAYIGRASRIRMASIAQIAPTASASILVEAVRDPRSLCAAGVSNDRTLRAAAAKNSACAPAMLTHLADDKAWGVRGSVASNPQTPGWLVGILASDPALAVRSIAAGNASCPPAAMKAHVGDDHDVRWSLVCNPSCPPQLLEMLAEEPSMLMRHAVAFHRRCSAETLDRLADQQPEMAHYNPGERISDSDAAEIRCCAAANPKCTPETLERLAVDPDAGVRAAAASNPSISPQTLKRLAASDDSQIRSGAASNPRCPSVLMRKLLSQTTPRSDEVSYAAAGNPACPQDLLWDLARGAAGSRTRTRIAETNPAAGAKMLRWLADSDNEETRSGVAANLSTPADLLSLLTTDDSESVRFAAASNPACPFGDLPALLDDPSPIVRTVARTALAQRSRTVP